MSPSASASLGYRLHAVKSEGRNQTVEATLDDFKGAIDGGKGVVLGYLEVEDQAVVSRLLTDDLDFDPLAVEDALSPNERPALHDEAHGLFLVVSAVEEAEGELRYTEIGIFVGRTSLLAVCNDNPKVIQEWFSRLQPSRKAPVPVTPGMQLHALLDAVVDDYFPVCDAVEDEVDVLEERVLTNKPALMGDVLRLKRRLLELRRRLTPIREVLNGLLRSENALIPVSAKRYLQDVYDHTLRITETIDVNRDILGGALEAHLATVSNNLNVVMKILTAGAMFFMTASFIAGVYGMNFEWMPELKQPWGYPFALGLMIVSVWIEVAYFKRKGWF